MQSDARRTVGEKSRARLRGTGDSIDEMGHLSANWYIGSLRGEGVSWYTMHRGEFFAAIAFLGALVLFTFAASPFLDLSPVANAQGQNSDIDSEIGVVVYPGDKEVKLTWKPSGNQNWDGDQEFGYQYKLVAPGQSSNWSPSITTSVSLIG